MNAPVAWTGILPQIVAVRAWDMAYVLNEDFGGCISNDQWALCEAVVQNDPEAVTAEQAADLAMLYGSIVDARV